MFRKVFVDVTKNGRKLVQGVLQKCERVQKNGPSHSEVARIPTSPYIRSVSHRLISTLKEVPNKGIFSRYLARFGQKNLAGELRRSFSGSPICREYRGLANKLSMYAFVGVGLASYKAEERDFTVICEEIKEIFEGKTQLQDDPLKNIEEHGLKDYHIGDLIAKGCNAAVYQAKYVAEIESDLELVDDVSSESGVETDTDSDIEVIEDDLPPMSFTLPTTPTQTMSFVFVGEEEASDVEMIDEEEVQPSDNVLFLMTCERELHQPEEVDTRPQPVKLTNLPKMDHDLAIKMMFNYGIESNASSLFRELNKELIPVRSDQMENLLNDWHNGHRAREKERLPPHPNIVSMYGGFIDDVPHLAGDMELYPDALPHRINPDGSGRNKTLFLVMKRYPHTLREYLTSHPELTMQQRTLILVQLVEATVHMTTHGVAHRDLKSDNIFIEEVDGCPHLVVSDFGDCVSALRMPYNTDEISRGGNMALQAPEIATATAGPGVYLDYSKSDLWAVGTLAYEIFGANNPFYRSSTGGRISSINYRQEDLPSMGNAPVQLENLVRRILCRDPEQRPSPLQVATYLHLFLWAPEVWQNATSTPGTLDIIRWMLTSTAQVILEAGWGKHDIKYQLRRLFMAHVDFDEVVHSVNELTSV